MQAFNERGEYMAIGNRQKLAVGGRQWNHCWER